MLTPACVSQLRKVEKFDQAKSDAQAEVAAANDTSIADERKSIDQGCKKLGVWVKEIEPDGHWCVGFQCKGMEMLS